MYEDKRKDQESRERIAVLETELKNMRLQHEAMAKDIRMILDTLSEARGGWRIMMLVGGGAGMLGAFISKWVSNIHWVLPK